MAREWAFDSPHATRFTEARIRFLNTWLPGLIDLQGLRTAFDAGCGVGHLSRYLADLGLEVVAIDGRPGNILEAQRRHPQVRFLVHNMEAPAIRELGVFDLVLCFGLLYHLENPFAGVRNLYSLAGKVLLVESMVVPGSSPIAGLVDEGQGEDQSLYSAALVLSQPCLVKMLYHVGFPFVYATRDLPDHEDFRESSVSSQKRTVLLAARIPLQLTRLVLLPEPSTRDPWRKHSVWRAERFRSFLRKPWRQKVATLYRKMGRFVDHQCS